MSAVPFEAIAFLVIALCFGFFNGRHDSSNIVATVISTRALRPRSALWMAAIAAGTGPFLFGVAVATTIGHEIVKEEAVTLPVVYAALLAAISWNLITLRAGIPSSTSHALIGGILGAAWAGNGPGSLLAQGVSKVLLALFLSPLLGMIAGYSVVKISYFLASGATPKVNYWFRRGQLLTAITLALAHGANDAQKTMGIITLGLVATGELRTSAVPAWVVLISTATFASGTLLGGWNLIRTLGGKFYRIRPIHGFGAQTASSVVILGAALLGGPVSTTHVVSSSIIGAGSADRIQMVRWKVFTNIIISWLLTIPATASLSALIYAVIRLFVE